MTRFIASTQAQRRIFLLQGERTKTKRISWSFPKSRLIILVLIILVGLVYLVQVNQVSTGGYEVKALEEKIEKLNQENKKLELKAVELQSLTKIRQATEGLNLVAQKKVDYIVTEAPVVALGE